MGYFAVCLSVKKYWHRLVARIFYGEFNATYHPNMVVTLYSLDPTFKRPKHKNAIAHTLPAVIHCNPTPSMQFIINQFILF